MNRCPGRLAAALVMMLALGRVSTAAAAPDEHERLAAERLAVEARFAETRSACLVQFFVNDCQEAARQQRRLALDGLRQQQLVLDEARRRERAAWRTQQQQQQQLSAPAPSVQASSPVLRPPRQAAAAASAAASSPAHASGEAINRHQRQQAFDQRQQFAREHQRAVDERNARQDAARPPAAGLPLPAASAATH